MHDRAQPAAAATPPKGNNINLENLFDIYPTILSATLNLYNPSHHYPNR